MHYELQHYNEKQSQNSDTYPKSSDAQHNLIRPDDVIWPVDGSYAITLENGVFKRGFVAFPKTRHHWKVLVTEGNFPIQMGDAMTHPIDDVKQIPGTLRIGCQATKDTPTWPINDLMCQSILDPNRYLFIHSKYVLKEQLLCHNQTPSTHYST